MGAEKWLPQRRLVLYSLPPSPPLSVACRLSHFTRVHVLPALVVLDFANAGAGHGHLVGEGVNGVTGFMWLLLFAPQCAGIW